MRQARQPDVDDPSDYADPDARLENTISYEWMHPISEIFTVLTMPVS